MFFTSFMVRVRRRRLGALLATSAALALTAVHAQGPTFRARTDIVQLDVAVLDKKTHQPVKGLTAKDFAILEDGRPVEIVAFDAVDVPDAEPPESRAQLASWVESVSPDVTTNSYDDRRLFVIVMDDAMIIDDILTARNAKSIGRQVIDRMGPNDLASVVFTRDNRHAQDFTSDKAKLRAAVNTFSPGTAFIDPSSYQGEAHESAVNTDSYQYEAAVRALGNAADYLVAAPNRRKALVYISEGVPVDFVLASGIVLAHGTSLDVNKPGTNPENRAIHQNLIQSMLDTYRRAQRANVAVYAFDPSPTLFEETLFPFLLQHGLKPGGGGQTDPREIAHHKANLTTDFLEATASNTGGRAVLKASDAPAGIEQMFVENSSYYLLGYHSPKTKTDSYRNVSVKVNRPGDFEIRARNRYYVEKAVDPKKPPVSAQEKAMAGMLPDAGMDLQLVTAPFPSLDPEGAAVVLAIGVKQEAPRKQGFQSVDYLVRAFTPEGSPKSGRTQKINVAMHAAEMGVDDEYDLLMTLPVKPGRYEIRAAVHNATLDRQGSVYGDVVVPDFSKDPLSLSGVIVNAKPARVASPYFATEMISPTVPTTRRVFTHDDRVSTYLRVYQAKTDVFAPVQVAIRIVDDHDNVVSDTTQTLSPDDFSKKTRSADVNYALPTVNLAAGNYLLTFEATAGAKKARREVRFSVR